MVGPTAPDRILITTHEQHQYLYELQSVRATIGRSSECALGIDDSEASRRHAELVYLDNRLHIRDLSSTNGTFLNDEPIRDEPRAIGPEDRIRIGRCSLRVLSQDADLSLPQAPAAPAASPADPAADTRIAGEGTIVRDETQLGADSEPLPLVEVVVHDSPCRITICEDSRVISTALLAGSNSIGRAAENDIVLKDLQASKRHATITGDGSRFQLIDEQSTNGTRLNGLAVHRPEPLNDGDIIRIGNATIHFTDDRFVKTSSSPHRRPVILIPGFGGTELWLGEERMWPNLRRVLKSDNAKLQQEWNADLTVGQMVREPAVIPGLAKSDSFAWLIKYLVEELNYTPNDDLIEFPYDWRKDNRQNAALLVARLNQWRSTRANATQKITIIAHSMGGLVARAALLHTEAADACERCIFLGTPHAGSLSALAAAIGGGASLPLRRIAEKVRDVVTRFDSFYQLLPSYPAAFFANGDPLLPLKQPGWLPEPHHPKLENAASFHSELAALRGDFATTCIFGYGQKTLARVVFDQANNGRLVQKEAIYSNNGDGIVGEQSAVLNHAEIHPVSQHHGALFTDPDVLRRLRYELLER